MKGFTVRAGSTEPIRLQLLEAGADGGFFPTPLLSSANEVEIRFFSPRVDRRWGYSTLLNPSRLLVVDAPQAIIEFRPIETDFVEGEEPIRMYVIVRDSAGRTYSFPRNKEIEIGVAPRF
jgi:hypothetical protein